MANNGYQQPYRQRPPPQQRYYSDHNEQKQHNNEQQNRMYNQRDQGYGQQYNGHYNDQNYNSYDSTHEQYDPWDDRQYNEQASYGYHDQQAQQYTQEPRQEPSYQYDDRYRMNAQGRQPPRSPHVQPPLPIGNDRGPRLQQGQYGNTSRDNGNYNYGNNARPSKVRERILQAEPESPKTAAWDNPFPTFPSKKKQGDFKNANSVESVRPGSSQDTKSNDAQRPSTSHSNRQRAEPLHVDIPRPRTSQSQRNFEPVGTPLNAPPIPLRTSSPAPRPQPSSQYGPEDSRPAPRRAMTQPEMDLRSNNYGQHDRELGHPNESGEPAYRQQQSPLPNDQYNQRYRGPSGQYYPEERDPRHPPSGAYPEVEDYPNPIPYQRAQTFQEFSREEPVGHQRQSSDQGFRRKPVVANDTGTYRGAPLTKKVSPDVPNFDLVAVNPNEKGENHLSPAQQQQYTPAYNKPTYQTAPVSQVPANRQHSVDDGNNLASPLSQFSFDLRQSGPGNQNSNGMPNPTYNSNQHDQQRQQIPQRAVSGPDRPMQYPQRNVSQPQAGPPGNPYGHSDSRPPPIRPGLAQPPIGGPPTYSRDPQGFVNERPGYDLAPMRNDGYGRPPMAPSSGSYQSDPSRHGYDQRIHPQFESQPSPAPPRPATSNSNHQGPPLGYEPRMSSERFQRNGMQNPDSLPAHPAPFRPGLMQSSSPAPRPTPPPQPLPNTQVQAHQRAPSGPKPPEVEPPVTVRELNVLREDYKQRPNDYSLGLRFAKRLVEAAKVLPSETGKTDPKQAAKNRERYILDAHKIVKRLCGAGYAEAMFYLADCYGQGLLGLEPDPKEAFSLYQSAAKLGHPQAAYRVAVCCELGSEEGGGTRRDPLKAVQWYKRAASLGDTPAMYKMGMILLKGLLGQTKSPREAISWLKRAAERANEENPHALHELGLLYENAQSTDTILKDEKYALQLFQQAADLGYKYSEFRLGSAYEYGSLGLPIDPRMSIAWYSRAAKQGEHQSEFALSGWYLTGSGQSAPGEQPLLQQSDTEAYLWARKAASSGLAKAEYAMGYYTEVGIGVSSNIEEAKRWYYRAAAQNHLKARERLEDLKKGGQRMQKTRVSRSHVGKHNEGECVVM